MPVRCFVPPKIVNEFAGARGRVLAALKEAPRSVTLSDALKQVLLFEKISPRKLPESK